MKSLVRFAIVAAGASFASDTLAQDYAFTYQGLLSDSGSKPTGAYDMRFSLWNDLTGGAKYTAIGGAG